jgi:hypothetical protein
MRQHRLKFVALTQALHACVEKQGAGLPRAVCVDYAASRARPFARRARMTARPPRVFMRARNPCVRDLLVLEGW